MVCSITITVLLTVFGASSAFSPVVLRAQAQGKRAAFVTSPLGMSDSGSNVPIVITGNNMEVTPALMDHVNQKMENVLGKLEEAG